jgi:molecular chaperone GrpE
MEHADEEEFIAEEDSEATSAAVGKLREKLKKAVEEKQEYLEGWQRSRADFANFKREEALMHTDKEARIKADFIEKLLPLFDSIELARHHEVSETTATLERQFLNSLKDIGIERFGLQGEKFDPYKHEALRESPTDKIELDHTILEVQRSGYRTGETIIRPAYVTIASYQK